MASHVVLFENEPLRGGHRHVFGPQPDLKDFGFKKVSSFVVLEGNWRFFQAPLFQKPYPQVFGPGIYRDVTKFGIVHDAPFSLQPTSEPPTTHGDARPRHVVLFADEPFRGDHRHVFEKISSLEDFGFKRVSSFAVLDGNWCLYKDVGCKTPYPPVFGPSLYHDVTDFKIPHDAPASLQPTTKTATAKARGTRLALTSPIGDIIKDELSASVDFFSYLDPSRHGKLTWTVDNGVARDDTISLRGDQLGGQLATSPWLDSLPLGPHTLKVEARVWSDRLWDYVDVHASSEFAIRSTAGRWFVVRDSDGNEAIAEVLAIHAALLRTNRILYFGGDEDDEDRHNKGLFTHGARLFHCDGLRVEGVTGGPSKDVFCAGQALMADGRVLVAGGTARFNPGTGDHADHYFGHEHAFVFDPASAGWVKVDSMEGGRWYPTLVTLADGRVLALSGHPNPDQGDNRHVNDSVEIFSPNPPPAGKWHIVGEKPEITYQYPRLHVLPDTGGRTGHGGAVFCTTTMSSGRNEWWAPATGLWKEVAEGTPDGMYGYSADDRPEATSVLLPLLWENGYQAHVLVCGGQQAFRINLDEAEERRVWRKTGRRALAGSPRRRNLNAVILPTGKVLVCGGAEGKEDGTGVLKAEVYDPATDLWSVLPSAKVVRNYHSVALLMPDGRVWTAGSSKNTEEGYGHRELRIEIFEPWYCSSDRPQILDAPPQAAYGEAFSVRTTHEDRIVRVALIRAGTATHSFNGDQRYVGLKWDASDGDLLTVTAPPNGTVAPPGDYLLFLVNDQGAPSEGRFMRLKT